MYSKMSLVSFWSNSIIVRALCSGQALLLVPVLAALGTFFPFSAAHATNKQIGLLEPHQVVLENFESEKTLKRWKSTEKCQFALTEEWASAGERALKITYPKNAGWPEVTTSAKLRDGEWPDFSEFEYIRVDMKNPNNHPAPPAGSSAQGMVFFVSGSDLRPDSQSTVLQPRQTRYVRIPIDENLSVSQHGRPLDPSKIRHFHFYVWNPTKTYDLLIDNIRLTRNLGEHFQNLLSTLDMLSEIGVPENTITSLKEKVKMKHDHFKSMPFSSENFQKVRQVLSNLEKEIGSTAQVSAKFKPLIEKLSEKRQWSVKTREQYTQLLKELKVARDKLDVYFPDNEYEQRAKERAIAEFQVLEAQLKDIGRVLMESSATDGFAGGWQHTGRFIKPYGKPFEGTFGEGTMAGARGEIVGKQLVVFALNETLKNTSVKILDTGGLPQGSVDVKALGFINMGSANKGSLAYKTQWYPDIIYDIPQSGIPIYPRTKQPFLLQVEIPRDVPAGTHILKLEITNGETSKIKKMRLRIYDFAVPKNFTLKTTTHSWHESIPTLIKYGLDPGQIYGSYFKDWRKQPEKTEKSMRQQYEQGQQLFNVENQSDWHVKKSSSTGWIEQRYKDFFERMEAIDIPRDCFFFYGFDEIGPGNAEDIRRHVEEINQLWDVPVMGTPMGEGWSQESVETFNMWAHVPSPKREWIEEIHKSGREAWWYDNDLGMKPDVWLSRHKGWYAHYWDMDGYLIYSTQAWSNKKEKKLDLQTLPYSNWSESSWGARGVASAVVYWDDYENGRRFPSLRLWNFRAGLYDFEYLQLLEKKLQQAYQEGVPASVNKMMQKATTLIDLEKKFLYPRNSELLHNHRAKVAEMIEVLSQ